MSHRKAYLPCFGVTEYIVLATSVVLFSCNVMPKSEVKTARVKSPEVLSSSTPVDSPSPTVDDASDNLSVYTGEASDICSSKTFINKSGEETMGTKDCSLGSLPDCKADGEVNCKTNAAFPAASLSNAVVSNIRSGVTIAGITGSYPSAAYPLAGADGTADLSDNQGTREAQLRSATSFEFFKSDGTRVVTAGDADIDDATNIKDQVVMFGRTGSYTGAAAPDPWDLRRGVTVAGVTGKLYVNCRNRVNSARYNYDGVVASIPNTSVTTGTILDYWDTIDDFNGGEDDGNGTSVMPGSVVSDWTNSDCQGREASAGDDKVWRDVTTTGDGTTASDCATTGAHCTMKDKITGLEWSKMSFLTFTNSTTVSGSAVLTLSATTGIVPSMRVSGTGIAAGARVLTVDSGTQVTMSSNATASASDVTVTVTTSSGDWRVAINYCDTLNHNGATNWRLPTQKELMEAYSHGLRSAASSNWIPEANMTDYFWSATSASHEGGSGAAIANLSFGYQSLGGMTGTKGAVYDVVCAR